ncbi:MAG TPA: AbrB/MazE/SpoVT family DNA-binding domain-containing protein [Dermatophilaceae bacterium]|nr:AbrB/MazE/SpoVT family DNA-binding domain-containing protein [Dermatophilaceae bacterium]
MTDVVRHPVKIGPSSRAVIPAQVRELLGVGEGDCIEFILDGGEVRVVSARLRMTGIWAKNHGGDAGESAQDVRELRAQDAALDETKWERTLGQDAVDTRTDDELAADLLGQLGV